MKIVFATRPSALARRQTRMVIRALQKHYPPLECHEKVITTQGDKILDRPLPEIGGKGLFTQELEAELLSGNVHCAVHSLKDLPVESPPGLTIGCIPTRGDVRDALISAGRFTLATLPAKARVGTSSVRRTAQLRAIRPDIVAQPLRGNVDTRVRQALDGRYEAIALAGAGLMRLGLDHYIAEWLPLEVMLPAPGQGALAVQCRADDLPIINLLSALDDVATRNAVSAERAFLSALGGGCAVPVAAHAEVDAGHRLLAIRLTGLVIAADGRKAVRVTGEGDEAIELGRRLARQAVARGADELLSAVSSETGL